MLDRLVSLEPGSAACAEKRVSGFPGGFPQVLLVECIAQLAGIAAAHNEEEGGLLATIDQAVFAGHAHEGDTLTINARIVKTFGRLCLAEGQVESAGGLLVEARLTLGIGRL